MRGPLVVAAFLFFGVAAIPASAGHAAVPSCAIADQVAPEGDNGVHVIEFKAICATALEHDLVYSIKTADGTAVAPDDYQAVDTTAGASAGSFVLSADVGIVGDTLHEGDETFTVILADPSGSVTFSRATATITILDNEEPPPVCTIPDSSFPEGDSGVTLSNFTITCDRRLPEDLSFHVQTADGTATANEDYVAIDGDGSVVAGQTTINGAVNIVGDTQDEPNETFTYSITDNAGIVSFTTGTITILDDDEPAPPPGGPCIMLSQRAASVSGPPSTPTRRNFADTDRMTVTNCGDSAVQISVRGTDATGDGATWELTNRSSVGPLDSMCELGLNLFRAAVLLWLPDDSGIGTPLTTHDTPLLGDDGITPLSLADGATREMSPDVELPCEGSDIGNPMTMTVTFTAATP